MTERIDAYRKVNKENKEKLNDRENWKPDKEVFTCTICSGKTSLAKSFSRRGRNLICKKCWYLHFRICPMELEDFLNEK